MNYNFKIEEEELVTSEEENEEEKDPTYYVKEMTCANSNIPIEYKRRAVKFWKPDESLKPRSLGSVKHRFRKVTSLRQLRRWQEQVNRGGTRLDKLKEISSYTLNKFQENLQKGAVIHNINIAQWALEAQEKINAPGFAVSEPWIKRFKVAHNIVLKSHKIYNKKN